ncbi:hypothetical protein A3I35_00875 [Candidatus Falkowbacteria bacterium RIFCSPLOWO2_02_FULL_45_15]|uniref:Uncharacterized protein n=1 Tax=Candidatus Falkowbacteria bacterium RIFCSPLOWO2_02_FULL_45_15 TaxID=1797988 RepID=A0A1F5S0C4_9BACT|nr:MAG: hypothetical protein A3I35_00875 [Candidatus Falkowbacteria bacterium RIFCSPLOWO2_02_FULL_45_15]
MPSRPSVPPSEARQLCQVLLLGFVDHIWQNNIKSLLLFFIGSQNKNALIERFFAFYVML